MVHPEIKRLQYNEEYARKSLTETGYEQGLEDGRKEGIEEGRKVGIEEGRKVGIEEGIEKGIEAGRESGKSETLVKSVDSIMQNLKLDLEQACEAIGTTQDEYIRAKREV